MLLEEMEDREAARDASNIPELIRCTKCGSTTCPNYDHNCIIAGTSKHHSILSANDLVIWDKAIKNGKATFHAPPLNIRGSPIQNRKGNVAITNQNVMSAYPPNPALPGPYAPPPYPYPMHYSPYGLYAPPPTPAAAAVTTTPTHHPL